MKLLFDQNLSYRIVKSLRKLEIDCLHINETNLKNPKDIEIFNFARLENFTIVSYDSDFIDLVGFHGYPPKLIKFTNGNLRNEDVVTKILINIYNIETFLRDETLGILEIY